MINFFNFIKKTILNICDVTKYEPEHIYGASILLMGIGILVSNSTGVITSIEQISGLSKNVFACLLVAAGMVSLTLPPLWLFAVTTTPFIVYSSVAIASAIVKINSVAPIAIFIYIGFYLQTLRSVIIKHNIKENLKSNGP